MNSHPSLQTQYYDGWLVRYSNGYTNRANSVCMIYPSTLDLREKIEECEKRYIRHHLPCVFKMTGDDEKGLDMMLEERGYQIVTPTSLMVMDLADKHFDTVDSVITEHITPEWLDTYFTLENRTNPDIRATATQMFNLIHNDTWYCRIEKDSRNIACASAVMERGYVSVLNVIVDEKYRGLGYGRRLLEALLNEAIRKGAHTSYLQVVQSNHIATHLYEKMGYKALYSYWYRVKKQW